MFNNVASGKILVKILLKKNDEWDGKFSMIFSG